MFPVIASEERISEPRVRLGSGGFPSPRPMGGRTPAPYRNHCRPPRTPPPPVPPTPSGPLERPASLVLSLVRSAQPFRPYPPLKKSNRRVSDSESGGQSVSGTASNTDRTKASIQTRPSTVTPNATSRLCFRANSAPARSAPPQPPHLRARPVPPAADGDPQTHRASIVRER